MSDYARLRLSLEVSDASDYSRPVTHGVELTATPDEARVRDVIEVATAGQSYPLSHLTACTDLLIYNADTTANGGGGNYMSVAYTSVANSGTNTIRIPAGKCAVIPGADITVASTITLTANTAAVVAEISYLGT